MNHEAKYVKAIIRRALPSASVRAPVPTATKRHKATNASDDLVCATSEKRQRTILPYDEYENDEYENEHDENEHDEHEHENDKIE